MDIQRTLLIGAIALLSFMLLSEWVAFRDAREADAAPATQRLTAGSVPASAQVPAASGDTDAAGEPATGELPADLPPPPDDTPETAAALLRQLSAREVSASAAGGGGAMPA